MKILQLHDPIVLKFPTVLNLFLRGLSAFGSPSLIRTELEKLIEKQIVIIGFEKIDPSGFSLIQLPSGFEKVPQVIHFHSEGSRTFTRALTSHTLDTVKKLGYNTLRAINGSGKSDGVWMRTFRDKDWTIQPKVTVFDFERKI